MRHLQRPTLAILAATLLMLCACSKIETPKTDAQQIKPAQNKMVILPQNFSTGLAVIQPPRAKDGFGDTKVQTIGALNGLGELLQQRGLNLGNVMQIHASLAPNANGIVDFDGYLTGFNEVFDTNKIASQPANAYVGVRSLPASGQYVMLEVSIAVPKESASDLSDDSKQNKNKDE